MGSLIPSGTGVVTEGLIGNFDPTTGNASGLSRWSNSIAGESDLEIKNGTIWKSGVSGNASHYEFDGVDDYIGSYDDIYNNSFTINLSGGFTICMWWELSGNTGAHWNALAGADDYWSGRGMGLEYTSNVSGRYGVSDSPDFRKYGSLNVLGGENAWGFRNNTDLDPNRASVLTGEPSTWHMISLTKNSGKFPDQTADIDYGGRFDLYVDDDFQPITHTLISNNLEGESDDVYYPTWGETGALLNVGKTIKNLDQEGTNWYKDNMGSFYAGQNFKLGRVLVYNKHLKNSEIRQNFLATKNQFLFTGYYAGLPVEEGDEGGSP